MCPTNEDGTLPFTDWFADVLDPLYAKLGIKEHPNGRLKLTGFSYGVRQSKEDEGFDKNMNEQESINEKVDESACRYTQAMRIRLINRHIKNSLNLSIAKEEGLING